MKLLAMKWRRNENRGRRSEPLNSFYTMVDELVGVYHIALHYNIGNVIMQERDEQ